MCILLLGLATSEPGAACAGTILLAATGRAWRWKVAGGVTLVLVGIPLLGFLVFASMARRLR